MFAKLYGPDHDQVLVNLATDDAGNPCIKFSFEFTDGIISTACVFTGRKDWEMARKSFGDMTEERARKVVVNFKEEFGALYEGT